MISRYVTTPLCALAIICSDAAEKSRTEFGAKNLAESPVELTVGDGYLQAQLEICFSMPEKIEYGPSAVMRVEFKDSDDRVADLSVCISVSDYADIYEVRRMSVTLNGETVAEYDNKMAAEVNLHGGDNYLLLSMDGRSVDVYIGKDRLSYCTSFETAHIREIMLSGTKGVDVMAGVLETFIPEPVSQRISEESITAIDRSKAADIVGIWTYLDRDNDPDYARPGGQYSIAILPTDSQDAYNIYYVDGAAVNRERWKPGMLKGRLKPLPLIGRYRLEWWGSDMHKLESEAHAELEDGVLTLKFPLLHSELRFIHPVER
ncbi:MAG: hypothetical protein K2J07_01185 [Muribaculaceae bacterium]|nr:hypothetical protein [Muribaculaceae bacterium]